MFVLFNEVLSYFCCSSIFNLAFCCSNFNNVSLS
ncbi:F-box protein [uncultured Clostridium sp.]